MKVVAVLLIIVGVNVGVAYGLSRPAVTIQEISVSGTEALSADNIKTVVEQELSGKYFFLFSRRSSLIYPRHNAKASVLDTYTRIQKVNISREGLQKIIVEVVERQPFATWCRDAVVVAPVEEVATTTDDSPPAGGESKENIETCYFLDEGGYIFAEAPQFTGDVYFRYYGSVDAAEPIDEYFLPEERFKQLSFFLSALLRLDVEGTSIRTLDKDYEIELSGGSSILFGQDQDLTDVLNNLETVILSDVFKEKDLTDLEYIDLRFGNKVYYKFK